MIYYAMLTMTINRLLGKQGVMLHLSVCALKHVHPPTCCIEAEGLFMGDATLRKIFWRQETLRGGTKVKESVLQPDRDLFLPSSLPLQRNKTMLTQMSRKATFLGRVLSKHVAKPVIS